MRGICRIALAIMIFVQSSALAWGPHWHITRAGLDALGKNHVLESQLGTEFLQLTNYCWLPDFRRIPFRVPEQDFYSDDYLLFPGVTNHFDHICPEVQQTYEPYFRRALQALRSESAPNAARWVGSLLHFVQDTGSPPHAARIRGDTHLKMENWVDASKISISGYVPRLLGTNDDDAVRGLKARMDEVIDFSKSRAQRLRLPILLLNRRAAEPIELESALECARATADLLHTIATLAANKPAGGFELRGSVRSQAPASEGRFPAKVMFAGTNISTLADSSGWFRLRGIQPGGHRVIVMKPGSETLETNLTVDASMTNLVFTLRPSGNLIRNGDFRTSWVTTNAPDDWGNTGTSWEGEILTLKAGQRYRVRADFQPDSDAQVVVRWSSEQPFVVPKPTKPPPFKSRTLSADSPDFSIVGGKEVALMLLTIRTPNHPTNALTRISVTPVTD